MRSGRAASARSHIVPVNVRVNAPANVPVNASGNVSVNLHRHIRRQVP